MKTFIKSVIISGFLLINSSVYATSGDPQIAEPQFARDPIRLGEKTTVTVEAQSPENLSLTYVWNAVSGTIQGDGPEITYTAPQSYPIAGLDTITVSVRDSQGRVDTRANVIHISQKTTAGKLYFKPEKQTIEANKSGTIKVWMDTDDELVDVVDLVIKYDPEMIKIQKMEALPLYDQIITKEINEDNIELQITGAAFAGEAAVAEINFLPLKSGETKLVFDHLTGDLLDSNLLLANEEDTDILGLTEEGTIQITPQSEPGVEIEYEYVYEYIDANDIPETPRSGAGVALTLIIAGGAVYLKSRK